MSERNLSLIIMFLFIIICVLFLFTVLTPSKANASIYFNSNGQILSKKKVQKNKKYVKKRRYTKQRKYYSKKKIYKSRKSGVVRSGLTKFKGHRMPVSVANKLRSVESKFGKIRIISSCRPGATVRKTGRPSMHRYCRAVDFNPPRGKYRQVARYLKTTWGGGVGTYSGRFNHIHIDDHRGRWHN